MFTDHPHIINYYGYEENVDSRGNIMHNIFLEYASCGSIADQIEQSVENTGGGLSEWEVRNYVKGVLLGLKDIHKQGFVHCDIKPDNILLVDGYVPKICDFGLAIKMGLVSHLRGTPAYFAPETIKYRIYTASADIWALGCSVLEMVTGRCAWGVPVTEENMSCIGNYEIVPQIPKGLSWEIQDFLKSCLVRNFGDRWNAESLLSHPFLQDPFQPISIAVGPKTWRTQSTMLPNEDQKKKSNLCSFMKELAI
ncbi:mitogen-activated protein kinase kinase kinase 20-like [Impatiens glandulifera]|uniref:mitogen-activated protein kinase kinase kinase 20-like n=1 Tax=Impatiens glandulifera TaxID=253017 RepID=UPI001FB13FBB|nr:mitogen-activated protein kinase kinase kinase 20-like [Impatiens glandulifera]